MTNQDGVNCEAYETVRQLVRPALDNINGSSLWLQRVVGTYGAKVDTVQRLAIQGFFSRETGERGGTFHITPNVFFGSWRNTEFRQEIGRLKRRYQEVPVYTSLIYARMEEAEKPVSTKDANEALPDSARGVVVTLNKGVVDLMQQVSDFDLHQKPEIVLSEAPPIEAILGIYPVDQAAAEALSRALPDLR